MNTTSGDRLRMNELCESCKISVEVIIEIVNLGIIEQSGSDPQSWQFSTHMVTTIHKALRLRQDLDIDWPGVAVALDLIEEMEQLRQENKRLHQRLNRFLAANHSEQ